MEQIKVLMGRIDALSIRERGIIFAAIVIIMFAVWDSVFIQPQVNEERKVLADLQMKRAEQSVLNVKFQNLIKQQRGDVDVLNRERLAQLKQQLDEIESNVRASTNHLIPPGQMAVVLQTILNKSGGLQLTEIKGLGASPLLAPAVQHGQVPAVVGSNTAAQVQPAGGGMDNAYKHGLLIRLEGDYMATLEYLRALEALEWGFFWENLEYEVLEYPRASVVITLYTLSLEKDWIGV
jgi:MSHA biogenesis protein MshJ